MRAMASEANQDIWPSNGLVGPPFVTCHLDTGRWSIVDKAHKSDMLIYSWNEMFQLPGKVSDLCHHIALARRHLKRKRGIANESAFLVIATSCARNENRPPNGAAAHHMCSIYFWNEMFQLPGKKFRPKQSYRLGETASQTQTRDRMREVARETKSARNGRGPIVEGPHQMVSFFWNEMFQMPGKISTYAIISP